MKTQWIAYPLLIQELNRRGASKSPFTFIIDYEKTGGYIQSLSPKEEEQVFEISIEGKYHSSLSANRPQPSDLAPLGMEVEPITTYAQRFEIIQKGLWHGDSFLANLTIKTPIQSVLSLQEIFEYTQARYKVFLPDHFVCFSPECFCTIDPQGKISTHPMKGTIDASTPDARKKIIQDSKELAEHATIVDLMRNDLSQIAEKVYVERFRYIDEVTTQQGKLLQVSSSVCGTLPSNWVQQVGSLLDRLLPAGSICGAPKQATVELIQRAEAGVPRNFYTGICGYFDGESLDTGVMIRFIEQDKSQQLYYRSGGGITVNSQMEKEYQEVKDKIYLPL